MPIQCRKKIGQRPGAARGWAIVGAIAALALAFGGASIARAGDWPQFRGPDGLSRSDVRDLPTTWGGPGQKNVRWKTPLPRSDNGFSSPIVCKGRVFLTSSVNRPLTQTVLCFNEADGKPLWTAAVAPGPWKLSDLRGGYGAPTPAADDEHVYALFGSAVLACLDRDGKQVWRREWDKTSFDVALGTSPILFEDTIILQFDQNAKKSKLIALDKKTGEPRWEAARPQFVFGHSSPVVATVGGKPILLVSGSTALEGIDPHNGKTLWSVQSQGETVSPAYADGIVYVDTGRGGGGVCVDIAGATPKVLWRSASGEMGEGLGSPLIVDGLVYKMHRGDVLLCRRVANGQVVFSDHLPQMSSRPSPFLSGDKLIYFASAGRSYVIRPGPKLDIVAVNDLGDPSSAPSPAVADGSIFLRGAHALFCVGK